MKFKEIFNKIKSLIKEKYRLAGMLNLKTTVCILFLLLLLSSLFNNHGTYKSMPELNIERAYHQSILIDEQHVLITGGINSSDNQKIGMKSAELYNIKGNKHSEILNTNIPHLFHSLFKMDDGNILIADINGIEIFDINNKKFKLLKSKPIPRHPEFYNTKFALLPNNLLLITGGRAYTGNSEHLKT